MFTLAEENYLKAIYHLETKSQEKISTNAIAEAIETKPSSVTDMVKKLADKQLLTYKKYKGTSLTELGKKTATNVIRKHRLWEVFLVDKLGFHWDEVHEIAEQLEHVHSEALITKLAEQTVYVSRNTNVSSTIGTSRSRVLGRRHSTHSTQTHATRISQMISLLGACCTRSSHRIVHFR